jgi:arylsulfatase A-like enzyme
MRSLWAVAAGLALLGCSADGPEVPARAPNIVLVVVDGMRGDRAHFLGNPRPTTPNLDALAAEGLVFELAFSQSNESVTSHAAIFTGRYPSEVARPDYFTYVIPDRALLIPEALAAVGYATGGFVAGGHVKAEYGFDQGYEIFEHGQDFGSFHSTAPMALRWIEGLDGSRPFFAFLHGYDCHRPYPKASVFLHPFGSGEAVTVPGIDDFEAEHAGRRFSEAIHDGIYYRGYEHLRAEHSSGEWVLDPWSYPSMPHLAAAQAEAGLCEAIPLGSAAIRHLEAHYDASVLVADTYLGLFVERLQQAGLWDDTLLIVTADHGEDLGDHGFYNHRTVIFDGTTRVPLVLAGGALPAVLRGTRSQAVVDALDLFPTIMDIAGSVPPAGARGHSLLASPDGTSATGSSFSVQQGVLGQTSVRTATHRLVFSGRTLADPDYAGQLAQQPIDAGGFSLFHSAVDPLEQRDILAEQPELAERLRQEAARLVGRLEQGQAARVPSEQEIRIMRDQGYW